MEYLLVTVGVSAIELPIDTAYVVMLYFVRNTPVKVVGQPPYFQIGVTGGTSRFITPPHFVTLQKIYQVNVYKHRVKYQFASIWLVSLARYSQNYLVYLAP